MVVDQNICRGFIILVSFSKNEASTSFSYKTFEQKNIITQRKTLLQTRNNNNNNIINGLYPNTAKQH